LGFAANNKVIDLKMQDEYSKLFEGHQHLNDSNLAALAAMVFKAVRRDKALDHRLDA
jgi:hypothetical protein